MTPRPPVPGPPPGPAGPPGPDRLAEHLARLGQVPGDAAHRALVAIAVTHQLDRRGRCRACARRRWARHRPGDCHTRRVLRAAVRDATAAGPPPAGPSTTD